MTSRRWARFLPPAVCLALAVAAHSCGGDPKELDTLAGGDVSTRDDADTKTELDASADELTDSTMLEADAASDGPRNGDGWFDGEYCPSIGFPPRTDGCPCDPGRSLICAALGKRCVYYDNCPPGPARSFECKWQTDWGPDGAVTTMMWTPIPGPPCPDPANDGG